MEVTTSTGEAGVTALTAPGGAVGATVIGAMDPAVVTVTGTVRTVPHTVMRRGVAVETAEMTGVPVGTTTGTAVTVGTTVVNVAVTAQNGTCAHTAMGATGKLAALRDVHGVAGLGTARGAREGFLGLVLRGLHRNSEGFIEDCGFN